MPLEATIYDKMILGLRNKDLIATFNWDPFLAQAYQRNMDSVGHENMPRILFLHGNVMIGACADCRMKGWTNNPCDGCKKRLEPSTLLYPVGEKNYTEDPFIKSEWDELRAYLEDAYLVTVFGYSAPITDVVARSVLLEAWHNNPTSTLGNLDIIDTKPKEEIRENWSDFFEVSHHGIYKSISDNYFSLFPRRTCDAFAMATLQQDPWHENPLPETEDLAELQAWVQHLVAEEKAGKFSGLPRDGRD